MFIDPKHTTPEYKRAVAALLALDENLRGAACAEVLSHDWNRIADRRYGRKKRDRKWWGWIKRKRASEYDVYVAKHDWRDHVECRQTPDGSRYFISHPYGMGYDDLLKLVHFCEANNLRCLIDGGSWYYPGQTVTVIVETLEQWNASLKAPDVAAA